MISTKNNNMLERFMNLEKVENIEKKVVDKHNAIFINKLDDFVEESLLISDVKLVTPRYLSFNQTCDFFFNKSIEDFTLWADEKYWVIELAHKTHVTSEVKTNGRNKR